MKNWFYLFVVTLVVAMNSMGVAEARFTGDPTSQSVHFVIVPGMNTAGGKTAIANDVLNPSSPLQVTYALTPLEKIDLGQKNCQSFLEQALRPLVKSEEIEKIVLHASSQGTATTLNYVSKNPEKVSAIILEAVFGSGNSFLFEYEKLRHPGIRPQERDYSHLPYKKEYRQRFSTYKPKGEQAIFSAARIPNYIPIIILHASEDPQLSIEDAKSVYFALRKSGNQSVYFLKFQKLAHVDLLNINDNRHEIIAINKIFYDHGLPYSPEMIHEFGSVNLSEFQPDPELFRESYELLIEKEASLGSSGCFWGSSCTP